MSVALRELVDQDEVRRLWAAVKPNPYDTTKLNPIVDIHMPVVPQVSRRLRRNFPAKADEITQEGYLGLVKSVRSLAANHPDHPNPTAYIIKSVHGRMRIFIIHDRLIRIPHDRFREVVKRGSTLFQVFSMHVRSHNGHEFKSEPCCEMCPLPVSTYIQDIMMDLQMTDREMMIVAMRYAGFQIREICAHMGLEIASIYWTLGQLQERFGLLYGNERRI